MGTTLFVQFLLNLKEGLGYVTTDVYVFGHGKPGGLSFLKLWGKGNVRLRNIQASIQRFHLMSGTHQTL
ncbi:hypothetical protein BC835DRAFT_1352750 [Cytidiella melzeri]|nr:hypothetical protein BC835DRAFT_1352750 [Cytidiella melzeri]